MPKKRVTTEVTLEIKLTVPYKKTPGHVLQFVTNTLQAAIEAPQLDNPPRTGVPSNLRITLVKKETTYV